MNSSSTNSSSTGQGHSLNGNQNHLKSCEPSISKDQRRHRPLTFLRVLRGMLCLFILLSTAFMMLVSFAPITTLLLRLFSVHHSRIATSTIFEAWLSLWPLLFEKINKTKVVFSGETVPNKERVLLFANHRTEVDWMYLWDLALRKGRLGYIKYILKSSLMKLPIFGWGFQIFEFIAVERKWEIDERIMQKKLSNLGDPQDPLWLVVFPEGTDYTEAKCIKSQQFAAETGLPILQNLLLPKTKGFNTCLQTLRNSLDAVYDVTIAYKHRCPTFIDNVFGVDPAEVHIHVQRFSIKEIPSSEKETAEWLIERFQLKDQLLSDFTALGYFPSQGTEGSLSTFTCLIKCSLVLSVTTILMYVTFSSFIWFKVYLACSCVYLSTLTYFDLQIPTVIDSIKALQFGKKKM